MKNFCFEDNAHRERIGILNDRLFPLTGLGHRQVRKAGRGLRKILVGPICITHSGFVRTEQTANEIRGVFPKNLQLDISLIEDNLVREQNTGYLHLMPSAEVSEWAPWAQDLWRMRDPFTFVPFGGESVAGMCEGRLLEFLQNIINDYRYAQNTNLVVVSHGRAIQGLRYILEGWSHNRMNQEIIGKNPPNCSVTRYEFDSFGRVVLKFENLVFDKRL